MRLANIDDISKHIHSAPAEENETDPSNVSGGVMQVLSDTLKKLVKGLKSKVVFFMGPLLSACHTSFRNPSFFHLKWYDEIGIKILQFILFYNIIINTNQSCS